jgi:O-antigen ligase
MSDVGMVSRAGAKTSYSSSVVRSVPWRVLTTGKGAIAVIGLFLFILIGMIAAIYPSATGIALLATTAVVVVLSRCHRNGIETWQIITLACLTGYIVLNYGFENLSIPLGPLQFLPIGELFMGAALLLAVFRYHGPVLRGALQNAPVLYTLALLLLTLIHLAMDVPNYGLYALRDATSSFEAIFLILGILWASQERNVELLTKWLMWLFIAATIYSYTFPWADQLENWSVTSGPFHPVALLGNYQEVAVYLVAGALFCIWIAPSVTAWPRWFLNILAMAQLAGLGILQSRTMYVGIALILLLLFFLREIRRMSQFLSLLGRSLAALVLTMLLLSAVGWKVQGRLGPMDMSGLTKELQSIWPSSAESAELGHESDRRAWYGEVWDKLRTSPTHMLLGVGYGQPLIDFMSETGQPIRQPHNSSMNVFGRLGLVGLCIWLLFLWAVMKRLWKAARQSGKTGDGHAALRLWLFAFCVLGLLDSMVQPYFEFSHSAVPFFFLLGVALGMNPKQTMERTIPVFARTNFSLRASGGDSLRGLPQ